MFFSVIGVCAGLWYCSSVLWRSRVPLWVVVGGTTSGIRASQVALGIFLAIRRASRADSVEIVCRSQISGSLVRGIVYRPQNNTKECSGNHWWSRSGQKLNLGFREEGKKSDFLSKL